MMDRTRLISPTSRRPAARSGRFLRLHLEPLEERKLLTTFYVNDNWANLDNPGQPVSFGDRVVNSNDTVNAGGIDRLYGIDAFGRVDGTSLSPLRPGFSL